MSKREHFEETVILPEGYRQLEYIESTETQYIDCAYVPDHTLERYDNFQLT